MKYDTKYIFYDCTCELKISSVHIVRTCILSARKTTSQIRHRKTSATKIKIDVFYDIIIKINPARCRVKLKNRDQDSTGSQIRGRGKNQFRVPFTREHWYHVAISRWIRSRKPRVALVAALWYHPLRARLLPDAVVVVDTSHHRRRTAFSIYVIQRCAMPFTGENMKTPLCVNRRCSLAFRVSFLSSVSPRTRPFPSIRFCSRPHICLSYVFALRISSRAFPGEGLRLFVSPPRSQPSRALPREMCAHSPPTFGEKDGR